MAVLIPDRESWTNPTTALALPPRVGKRLTATENPTGTISDVEKKAHKPGIRTSGTESGNTVLAITAAVEQIIPAVKPIVIARSIPTHRTRRLLVSDPATYVAAAIE